MYMCTRRDSIILYIVYILSKPKQIIKNHVGNFKFVQQLLIKIRLDTQIGAIFTEKEKKRAHLLPKCDFRHLR